MPAEAESSFGSSLQQALGTHREKTEAEGRDTSSKESKSAHRGRGAGSAGDPDAGSNAVPTAALAVATPVWSAAASAGTLVADAALPQGLSSSAALTGLSLTGATPTGAFALAQSLDGTGIAPAMAAGLNDFATIAEQGQQTSSGDEDIEGAPDAACEVDQAGQETGAVALPGASPSQSGQTSAQAATTTPVVFPPDLDVSKQAFAADAASAQARPVEAPRSRPLHVETAPAGHRRSSGKDAIGEAQAAAQITSPVANETLAAHSAGDEKGRAAQGTSPTLSPKAKQSAGGLLANSADNGAQSWTGSFATLAAAPDGGYAVPGVAAEQGVVAAGTSTAGVTGPDAKLKSFGGSRDAGIAVAAGVPAPHFGGFRAADGADPDLTGTVGPSAATLPAGGAQVSSDVQPRGAPTIPEDGTPAGIAPGTLTGAHLLQSLGRSAMQVHLDAAEFGRVSVHATYGRDGIAAQINLESSASGSALHAALMTHVPLMEQKLAGEHGARAAVSVTTETGAGPRQGSDGGARREQASSTFPHMRKPLIAEPSAGNLTRSLSVPALAESSGRLDIRI